ncbi:MAG TPA: hypothetical protein VGJ31_10565 [Dongiaceae bacterium]
MISNFIKRPLQPLALAAAVAFGALSFAAPANAGWHGGGWHGGGWGGGWHGGGWGCCWGGPRFAFSFGFPSYYPYAYPYPAYYPPYPAYAPGYSYSQPYYPSAQPYYPQPPQPPVNVAQAPAGPPPQQNWYYCDNPRGFYPYVQNCNAGWRSVPAQPPGTQQPN